MADRFPQEAVLRNGKRVLIRRFESRDTEDLHRFFLGLPREVRRFAWDDIEDRSLVESWGRNIDYAKVLPLLAINGERIVADATLHRREGGPLRLVGRIKWLIDPEYRAQGLGTILINDFINIARAEGLRFLSCLLLRELEHDAIATLTGLGFRDQLMERYGTDPDGNPHDMVKLVLEL
jgi:GNAT superfamily N-acetyltransferase